MATDQRVDGTAGGLEATVQYLSLDSTNPVNYPSVAGGEAEYNTGDLDLRRVQIRNARLADPPFSLESHGFELRRHVSAIGDFLDTEEVESTYAAELRALLLEATGGSDAFVFDFTRRSDSAAQRKARMLRDPSLNVHNDYTPRSAAQRLRDFAGDRAATLLGARFAIVNVWRSIGGIVQTTPLALCDPSTMSQSQLVSVERRAKDRIGEIYQLTYDPGNVWYYFPDMDVDEVLLIKTFDSAGNGTHSFAPHCSFNNPLAKPDATPRTSIEARAFVFF